MYEGVSVLEGESNDSYHADLSHMSCSAAKTLLDSPLLYYHQFVQGSRPAASGAMAHGTLMHRWLEEGQAFLDLLVCPPPDALTPTGLVGAQARKWAAQEAPPTAVVVSPSERAEILAEVAAILGNPAAADLIGRIARHEVSVRWTHKGHPQKCRFDAVTSCGLVLDLKTTSVRNISANFWKSVLDFRYHLQDAWYRRGMEASGMEAAPLRFIVVSTSTPPECQVVTLPESVVREGARLMDKALESLALRRRLNYWNPDYHGEVVELSFPEHALRSFV